MKPASARACARLLLLCLALSLGGCFLRKDDSDLQSGADQLYERGTKSMNSGNFSNAIQYFEALEARYPFSNKAKQAQLDLLYTYYRNNDRDQVIDASIQFERENPTHPRVDYALYMRGLAQFSGQHNRFYRLMRVDLAKRPPVEAEESFSAFAQLVKRYPDSIYTPDARQRMIFLRNRLAAYQIYVADYYMRRGAWAAALNRARYVVETYDGSPSVARALDLMAQAFGKLGMRDISVATREVLEENYPGKRFKQYGEARAHWWWMF